MKNYQAAMALFQPKGAFTRNRFPAPFTYGAHVWTTDGHIALLVPKGRLQNKYPATKIKARRAMPRRKGARLGIDLPALLTLLRAHVPEQYRKSQTLNARYHCRLGPAIFDARKMYRVCRAALILGARVAYATAVSEEGALRLELPEGGIILVMPLRPGTPRPTLEIPTVGGAQ